MPDVNVMVLVGSLRAASINRQFAELAAEVAPVGVTLDVFDRLGELPFYNEDAETANVPEPVKALWAAGATAHAALVVTPEYNGGPTAVLKNAIDWLSRPIGCSVLTGKPVAVIGAAAGQYGGVWAHDETRKNLSLFGPRVIESLKLSVSTAVFDGKHPRENHDIAEQLARLISALAGEAR
jgi:NAD(P)H-dependent FMN reductase